MEEIVFPNKLRGIRKSHGMGMQEIADLLKLSLSAISKIERGYRRLNQDQMVKLTRFFNCSADDILLSINSEEDKEILAQWQIEAEKRIEENNNSGLKLFGAGIRFLRKQLRINLADFAKRSGMAVSVYHKVEMGQREVYQNEIKSISNAFGMTQEELVEKIKEHSIKGTLNQHLRKNAGEFKITTTQDMLNKNAKTGGYKVPIYYDCDTEGNIIVERNSNEVIECPINLEDSWKTVYAIKLQNKKLGKAISENSLLFADTSKTPKLDDIALIRRKKSDGTAEIKACIIKEDIDGRIYGIMENPDEKISLTDEKLKDLDKVVFIMMK